MVDAIIILVVVIILIFALKGSIKHFRGEGLLRRRIRQRKNEKSEKEDAQWPGGRTAHDPYYRHALSELC